jgi:hypothetical protein
LEVKIKTYQGEERREYIRLDSVFPVEFQIIDKDKKVITELIESFTRNIGKGGLCIEVNNLPLHLVDSLINGTSSLSLRINIPLSLEPVKALGSVKWIKKVDKGEPNKYLIGLDYSSIDKRQQKRIIGYARWLKRRPRIIASVLVSLLVVAGLAGWYSLGLRIRNELLVKKIVHSLQEKSSLEMRLDQISAEKLILEEKLENSDRMISSLKSGIARAKEAGDIALEKEKLKLKEQLTGLIKEREKLNERLAEVALDSSTLKESLGDLSDKQFDLEKLAVEKMYAWLKLRQNRYTGLVVSYEGDPAVRDWAFTYDQALAAQAFLLFGDYDRARMIFDFFKDRAQKVNGGFTNTYYATGGEVAEYTVHTGPNVWMAISLLQYTNASGDRKYLGLAEDIASWVSKLQAQDPEGGLCGGPQIAWFSTEHNLDSYAMFTMLYEITGNPAYQLSADKIMNWLRENVYSRSEGRILRGKGDSTIATDTFAWAICAIGPERLLEKGMDPEQIIEFALDNCGVTVVYLRPDAERVKITGFDFAKARNLGRGGVVSSEWTAQMIIALKVMEDFYRQQNDMEKAGYYKRKKEFYLGQLGKLTISSPSWTGQGGVCFPYATQGSADTGHGWRTPKGKQTGSLSGTVYAIFAQKEYNPLGI